MDFTALRSTERDLKTAGLQADALEKRTKFGLSFLDDALFGMLPNDLVLVGAKSGRGKSALAVNIAKQNARAGKKVVFIALEAEENEIEMRLRYQIEAGLYFKDEVRDRRIVFNYRNWRFGRLSGITSKYKKEADDEFTKQFSSLVTVYRRETFNIRSLERLLDIVKDTGELVIVDHLHYLDLETGKSETEAISGLMKKIRALNLYYNKPLVMVAHLRKHIETLTPEVEDFMGSSDIGKIATTCIMLTPRPNGYEPKEQLSETIVSIPKSRTGGLGNTVGLMQFSLRHQAYMPFYKLGTVIGPTGLKDLDAENYPDWARYNIEKGVTIGGKEESPPSDPFKT